MLNDLNYKLIYRSNSSDFDRDFMIPCYKNSTELWRGSGYFSLSSLCRSFEGLLSFVENNGSIKLVCSPQLEPEDVALITAGLTDKDAVNCILRQIKKETPEAEVDKMDVICNMIHEGVLEIKIAFKKYGMYHEKIGIFQDSIGNRVAYLGSNNETFYAKAANLESFSVYKSWSGEEQREGTDELSSIFQKMWNNQDSELEVIEFSEAIKKNLFELFRRSDSLQEAINQYQRKILGKKSLYPFQRKAIDSFFENDCCHFFEMATGTGKTFTSVKLIEEYQERSAQCLFTVICVPQIDLQVQWKNALEAEGFDDIILFGGICSSDTEDVISDAVIRGCRAKKHSVCIAVYDTFFSKVYNRIDRIKNLFIVVDEAHNLTSTQLNRIPQNVKSRLGLSATIQRFSEFETENIIKYFTKETVKPYYYGIEDAIANGFLSHYEYYPIEVRMNDEEFELYQKKTAIIATELSKEEWERDDELLNKMRTERSLIVKKTASKLTQLEKMTRDNYIFKNSVVYCGQGKDKDTDSPIIDQVTQILSEAGLEVSTFTSKTESRPMVLESFESGYYDTLVAIKCFDEGVDVPKLDKIYIMASDTAIRQTVQRRGRVLRICKESGKNIAYIYDMVVLPVMGRTTDIGVKSLIVNEFRRVMEYARLADNKESIMDFSNSYFNKYGITDKDFEYDNN